MISDKDILEYIEYCNKIVRKICREKNIYGDVKEELLSEGMVGLARALKRYDAQKGTSLETYIYENVKNEINRYLRNIVGTNPNGKKRASFNATHVPHLDNIDNIDIFYNVSNNIDKRARYKDLLQKSFLRLSKKHIQIIILHNAKGFTFNEIGQQLRYTTSNAHALYHRAILKFKTIYYELIKNA